MMIIETVERAWIGGPLRRAGTGNGKPSKYVCEKCRMLALTGVRLSDGVWVCASCERGLERRPRKHSDNLSKWRSS